MRNFLMFFAVFTAVFLMIACSGGGSSSNNNDSESESIGFSGQQCYEDKTCNDNLVCDEEKNVCVKNDDSDENSSSNDSSLMSMGNSGEKCKEDKTCNKGLICDEEKNICIKVDNDNSQNDDSNDGTLNNDESDICLPNPCKGIENSTELCIHVGDGYSCECDKNYTWDAAEKECLANTQTSSCINLPFSAKWNMYNTVIQTWDGESWQPETTGVYNETPSQTECRFVCKPHSTWDGENCVCDEGYLKGDSTCENPCKDDNPCEELDHSTKVCTVLAWNEYYCGCDTYYAWFGTSCDSIPVCSTDRITPCNSRNNLNWSASKASLTWDEAASYCKNLTEGGFTDWRLPTIVELRTLIRECANTVTNGKCAVKEGCMSGLCYDEDKCSCEEFFDGRYSIFGDTDWFWSSDTIPMYTDYVWSIHFSNAEIGRGRHNSQPSSVRCVR